MTYEGFLRVGGVEVVNTERARGYTRTADCPDHLVVADECDTLQDALGDAIYEYAEITSAPWYDQSLSDLSGRFYGVVGLEINGTNDSTRSSSRSEGVTDGGVIGRTRKAMRGVRVRATIMARGRDALDYGSQWMSSVFDGNCSLHGDACSTTDAEFFADCPPGRGMIDTYTDWAEIRRNLALNPRGLDTIGWTSNNAPINPAVRGTAVPAPHPLGITTAVMCSSTGTNGVLATVYNMDGLGQAGSPARALGVWVYVNEAGYRAYDVDLTPNLWTYVKPPAFAADGYSTFYVNKISGNASTTARAYLTGAMAEPGVGPVGTFFDGSTEGGTNELRYRWLGNPDESPSVVETRSAITRPRNDAEYELIVNPLRRFLHDISVTSGPIDVEEFDAGGGFYAKTVEWTMTSERAWVYGMPKTLELTPTIPSVIQDIPYNLIPYPSAEIASGLIAVATNISTNPSVETNDTGWTTAVGGAITAAMITSGRVTGELAAAGTSSFRVVFTATGASAALGEFIGKQDISLASLAVRSRLTISLWAAETLIAGAPVREDIHLEAVWLNASNAVLRTDLLGDVPVNGGFAAKASLVPPAGATTLSVRARARLTSWNAGTIVRLYVDALTVSVP